MYKNIVLTAALLINIYSFAQDTKIIPGASYYVYDHANPKTGYYPSSTTVTFYTFDGQPLRTIKKTDNLRSYLDKQAPRPQPDAFCIIYHPPREQGPQGYQVAFLIKMESACQLIMNT